MKIRIGNDIRLKIQLPLKNESGEQQPTQILSARAFFINSTLEKELKDKYIKKNRFIGRFPIEPFVNEFEPTKHNINCSGYPKYHAYVHNEYKGFGVYPNWKECFPFKDVNLTRYESDIEYTGDRDKIIVSFPAAAQRFPGKYSLVVVGEIYDAGYKGNKRTVTVNATDLFEIVSTTEEQDNEGQTIMDNSALIEINNVDSDLVSSDIYVVSGRYSNNNINLGRSDNAIVAVDISSATGWYEEEDL